MTDLGPEWKPDAEGVLSRQAARLILFDADGKVLLISGHDTHDLEHQWWFTVGGGLDEGEEPIVGAIREAHEETGLVIERSCVVGPVMHRNATFRFRNVVARQDEEFFIAYLSEQEPVLRRDNLTELEEQTLDRFAWLSPQEVLEISQNENVYPLALPELLFKWNRGWDGTFVELGIDQREDT